MTFRDGPQHRKGEGEPPGADRPPAFVSERSVLLGDVWEQLRKGSLVVVQAWETSDHHVMQFRVREHAEPLAGRQLATLERGLRTRYSSLAIEWNVALSTIALNMRLALEHIGVHRRPSRVPAMLVVAAWAAGEDGSPPERHVPISCEIASVEDGFVARIPRLDRQLASQLTQPEFEVVRALVDGKAYEEMAREQGIAVRTVANQIAAVFRRQRVSGRAELLNRLCESLDTLPRASVYQR